MIFIKKSNDEWLQMSQDKRMGYNYFGGYEDINYEEMIVNPEIQTVECNNWHELYLKTGFCPLEVDIQQEDIWVSPEGKLYDGQSYFVKARYLCEIIYGLDDVIADDELISRGWIKTTENKKEIVCTTDEQQKMLNQWQKQCKQ